MVYYETDSENEIEADSRLQLHERLNPMKCLCRISNLMSDKKASLENIAHAIITLIPQAMTSPQMRGVSVVIEDQVFKVESFHREASTSRMCFEINTCGEPIGYLEIYSSAEKSVDTEAPFSTEEQDFLRIVADLLGQHIESDRTERELRKNSRIVENIFDAIQDGISLLDKDLIILKTNRTMEKWYSSSLPLIGRNCYAVYQGRGEPCEKCPVLRAFESRRMQMDIVPLVVSGQTTGWLELFAFPVLDSSGHLTGIVEYVRDVTERIKAQEALRRSEEKFRRLIENISHDYFFYFFDPEEQVAYVSPSVTNMLGYPIEESIEYIRTILQNHADTIGQNDTGRFHEERNPVEPFQIEIMHKDGTLRKLEIMEYPVFDAEGQMITIEGLAHDVTRREEESDNLKKSKNELERQVMQHTRDLMQACHELRQKTEEQQYTFNQLVRSERLAATGQLAASIAHEINSPLQGISSLLNVIQKTHQHDEDLMSYLNLLKQAFGNIRDIVKSLLDLNRPGTEQKDRVNINTVVENTLALVRSYLKKKRIGLHVNYAQDLPDITGSPQQLGQVLINLVNNAVEAICEKASDQDTASRRKVTENGKIVITTGLRNNNIIVEMTDSGPGIPKENLEKIFDLFFTMKKGNGMGVGLSICRRIIENHQGSIRAENLPDRRGMQFAITLPVTSDSH